MRSDRPARSESGGIWWLCESSAGWAPTTTLGTVPKLVGVRGLLESHGPLCETPRRQRVPHASEGKRPPIRLTNSHHAKCTWRPCYARLAKSRHQPTPLRPMTERSIPDLEMDVSQEQRARLKRQSCVGCWASARLPISHTRGGVSASHASPSALRRGGGALRYSKGMPPSQNLDSEKVFQTCLFRSTLGSDQSDVGTYQPNARFSCCCCCRRRRQKKCKTRFGKGAASAGCRSRGAAFPCS